MRMASLAAIALVAALWAQAAPEAERFLPTFTQDWTKTYSPAPFKESWSATISVKDLDRGLTAILSAAKDAGASLTGPLESFPRSETEKSQQLSFVVPAAAAAKFFKTLGKIGASSAAIKRPLGESVSAAEVKNKIDRLMADKSAHGKELAVMPAVSSLLDETLERLFLAEAILRKASTQVLFNLTVSQAR